jgi:DNA (cytosine-5)-methyltransferase 1
MTKLVGLSLFSNIGVAEAYLEKIGVHVAVANELLEERAAFYQEVYPNTNMICGDITNSDVYQQIIDESKRAGVNFIMATPPCQGMSTAGKQNPNDVRNWLIVYAMNAIRDVNPKFILLENVPQQLKTKICINGQTVLIPDYIRSCLENDYVIHNEVVSALDYGVPQMRQRSIFLCVRKDVDADWTFLNNSEKCRPVTMEEAIGWLPSVDPEIQGYSYAEQLKYFPDFEDKKQEALRVSKWHYPPKHKFRHVEVMRYTPEGQSALNNERHYPVKPDGQKIKGYDNTYKRQWWDKPGYTITTYNGAVCSHDNVHPGRPIGKDEYGDSIFSDARVLTIFELMIIMSLPVDWGIPDWASDSLIRHAIGEGIPPLIIKKLFERLIVELNK